jgi:hypothetical protein
MILDHLKKIYIGALHSFETPDEEFLKEYCEKKFAEKAIETFKAH